MLRCRGQYLAGPDQTKVSIRLTLLNGRWPSAIPSRLKGSCMVNCEAPDPTHHDGTGPFRSAYATRSNVASEGNLDPNIGSPLRDVANEASSWMTSQCSFRTPFSRRTMSTTIQSDGRPIPENRPCSITKSPSAMMVWFSYRKVAGALRMRSNKPARPGGMWALCCTYSGDQ